MIRHQYKLFEKLENLVERWNSPEINLDQRLLTKNHGRAILCPTSRFHIHFEPNKKCFCSTIRRCKPRHFHHTAQIYHGIKLWITTSPLRVRRLPPKEVLRYGRLRIQIQFRCGTAPTAIGSFLHELRAICRMHSLSILSIPARVRAAAPTSAVTQQLQPMEEKIRTS